MKTTQASKVSPSGDTPRRMSDAINQHAELLEFGQFQERSMAELADEDATLQRGRSFYVHDESGGPCIVVSDGSDWRRIQLGAVAS